MLDLLPRAFVRSLTAAWLGSSAASWRSLPVPDGPTVVTSPGDDPDRLLLIGSGIAVGYGTTTHEHALGGQLARQLTAITGRGTRVEVISAPDMPPADLRDLLVGKHLRALDAIIATPGGAESLLSLRPRAWRRQVDALLDFVAANAPASLHVFFPAIPAVPSTYRIPRLLAIAIRFASGRLNRQLRHACAVHTHATFLPLEAGGGPQEAPGTYARWAASLAPAVSHRLNGHLHRS